MAGYADVLTIIENHIATNFSACPVSYDNVPDNLSKGQAAFVRVSIEYDSSQAAEAHSGSVKRTWGSLLCEFHSKLDIGSKTNLVNLDAMAALFDYTVIDTVAFRGTTVLAPAEVEGWFITPALISFYFNR